jgi:hypothetical protein
MMRARFRRLRNSGAGEHPHADSVADADESRRRLVDSGVLDCFDDKHGPNVVEEAAD